jgi:hypothetical protein
LSLWNCERWKWSQHWIEKESGEWSKISFSYRNPSVYSLCCTIWNRIASFGIRAPWARTLS